jgi:hypothetical protein
MDRITFETLSKKTGMQDRAIRMARLVLVEGIKPAEAANSEGVSRQLAENAAKRILRQQQIEHEIPEHWIPVSVSLPKELAEMMLWIYQKARVNAGLLVGREKPVPTLSAQTIELIIDLIAGKVKK